MGSLRLLYGAMILAGIGNAVVKPAALLAAEEGIVSAAMQGFGINPVVWMAVAIGTWRVYEDGRGRATPMDVAIAGACCLGLLVPVASVSWMALGSACLLGAWVHRKNAASIGLVIAGVAAMRDPAARALLDVFAGPVLAFDAAASTWLLTIGGQAVDRTGNIIQGADDHSLLIMTGCSSMTNISFALLAWTSVMLGFTKISVRYLLAGGVLLAAATVFLNAVRLSLMTLSRDAYVIVHDGWGADVFLALSTMTTVICVSIGLRYARA